MSWVPYFLGTRIERRVRLRDASIKVFLDGASEVLQERGFVEVAAGDGLVVLESPGLWRLLNTIMPGSEGIVLRARLEGTDTIHFSYDAHHLREAFLSVGLSLFILFSDTASTMLFTIPLILCAAWWLPYFHHIDFFKRILDGPRDIFKHLRDRG
jgi:hypothetical protein